MKRFFRDAGAAAARTKLVLKWAVFSLVGLLGLTGTGHAAAIRTLANLASITFWEVTNNPTFPIPRIFFNPLNNPALTRIPGPLGPSANDFIGTPIEFYDVFYSDANGDPNIDGECLTVESEFNQTNTSQGGGLNIAEVQLTFADESTSYMCELASAVYLGTNFVQGSAELAVDGFLANSFTVMGNTSGQPPGARLRITLCSPCAVGECKDKNIGACKGKVVGEATERYEKFSLCAVNQQAAAASAQSQAFAAAQAEIDDACDDLRCGEQTCKGGNPAHQKVCQLNKKQKKPPSVECVECNPSPLLRCVAPLGGWDCVVRETFKFECECKCGLPSLPD